VLVDDEQATAGSGPGSIRFSDRRADSRLGRFAGGSLVPITGEGIALNHNLGLF
jgi:hypothetical protein